MTHSEKELELLEELKAAIKLEKQAYVATISAKDKALECNKIWEDAREVRDKRRRELCDYIWNANDSIVGEA